MIRRVVISVAFIPCGLFLLGLIIGLLATDAIGDEVS